MSATAFKRARAQLNHASGRILFCHFCGLLAGLLYVAWMVLLVLLVELVIDQGRVREVGESAAYARKISQDSPSVEGVNIESPVFMASDTGMLPMVLETRGHWYGSILAYVYRNTAWTHFNLSYLIGLVVLALIIGAIRVLLLYLQNLSLAAITTEAISTLQRSIFRKKFLLGGSAFDDEIETQVEPLLEEKLPALHQGFVTWLQTTAREPARIAVLLGFIFVLNLGLGLSFLLMAALAYVLGTGMVRTVVERRRLLARRAEEQLHRLAGLASKLRLIRGYAAEEYFNERYEEYLNEYFRNTVRRLRYEGRASPTWQFLGILVLLSVAALAGQSILSGRFALASAAGVFASIVSMVLPARNLLERWRQMRDAGRAADAIFEFLDTPPGRQIQSGNLFLNPLQKTIEFVNVSYRNIAKQTILSDLSIRIHAGQRIALIGTNEIEQRAMIFLLTRFIEPSEGSIRIDGVDLPRFTLESLRSHTCLVLQSDMLFPDTVANNIGCGDKSFSLEQIMEAAKVAHAHHFIQRLPHGYDCVVGEAGFPLKVGERYRIALARAILRDPPVVVIEEPKEPLDEDTKAMLDDTMARFLPGRTVLFLPHRLSTIRLCEKVFLFDRGQLVACGTHRELLETSELYRHIEYTRFQSHLFSRNAI